MKQESDKDRELDDLFKSGLGDPMQEPAFREEDWDAMEAMLDERKKRSAIIGWLPVIATIAAVALLFLAWALLSPRVTKTDKNDSSQLASSQVGKKHIGGEQSAGNSSQSSGSQLAGKDSLNDKSQQMANAAQQPAVQPQQNNITPATGNPKPSALTAGASTGKQKVIVGGQQINSGSKAIAGGEQPTAQQNGEQIASVTTQPKNNPKLPDSQPQVKADQPKTTATDNIGVNSSATTNSNAIAVVDAPKKSATDDISATNNGNATAKADAPKKSVTDDVKPSAKPKLIGKGLGYKPQLAITALASSDFNGVGSSFTQTRVGGNFGALFSVGITRKFTISTGAIYSIKPYAESNSQYHTAYQFKLPLQQVVADCRMLDIPINVDYQLYHAHNNKFSVGTGLSSYLMMSEKYSYTYAPTDASGDSYVAPGPGTPASYNVPHPGKYYLGVLNLQATYQRQVNSKFGIAVQPYMKVPLGNVGFSQVKLQSTGLAVGVSYNISSGGR